jgi:LPXTG-site transpeptidase (sortase) family protein
MRSSVNRVGAGIVIIGVAVLAFMLSQQRSTPTAPLSSPTPARILTLTATALPQNTKVSERFLLLAAKAKLFAPIIPVYFGADNTWDLSSLEQNAGYLEGTPPIGIGGNHVLVGHVEMHDGSAGPFAYLDLLKAGDEILITETPDGVSLHYAVTIVKSVAPDAVDEMRNHGYEELTLITCGDYDFKTNSYLTRLVVHARPTRDIQHFSS